MASKKTFTFTAKIPYETNEDATMVQTALAVDAELRPECVTRTLTVEDNVLIIHFDAVDGRTLRAAVGTFLDLVALASRTLETFPRLAAS